MTCLKLLPQHLQGLSKTTVNFSRVRRADILEGVKLHYMEVKDHFHAPADLPLAFGDEAWDNTDSTAVKNSVTLSRIEPLPSSP
jgi:hypothetical protein